MRRAVNTSLQLGQRRLHIVMFFQVRGVVCVQLQHRQQGTQLVCGIRREALLARQRRHDLRHQPVDCLLQRRQLSHITCRRYQRLQVARITRTHRTLQRRQRPQATANHQRHQHQRQRHGNGKRRHHRQRSTMHQLFARTRAFGHHQPVTVGQPLGEHMPVLPGNLRTRQSGGKTGQWHFRHTGAGQQQAAFRRPALYRHITFVVMAG